MDLHQSTATTTISSWGSALRIYIPKAKALLGYLVNKAYVLHAAAV